MEGRIKESFKYIVLLGLIYMPIFGHLDTLPIRVWDEARLVMNAYNMKNNGDFIVTYYGDKPDRWNTKPPLMIWLQVLSMKLFGENEVAVRLPSAFAAFFTCLALLILALRYLKSFWVGFIIIIILITSSGYVGEHATRTGDYDALLTLFTTLGGLSFFIFYETYKNKYLYLFFTFMALAVLTKSIAGLLFLPGLFLYVLWKRQLLSTLKNKHFYIGFVGFVALVLGYYLLREWHDPGYLTDVQTNELGGRYLNVLEDHEHPFWFYYKNLKVRFSGWYLLIPCGLVLGLVTKEQRQRRIVVFSSLLLITYFLVVSSAQTKLPWYDVQMYPFLAILVGTFIYYIFNWLKTIDWFKQNLHYNIIPFVFLFLVAIGPYQSIIKTTYLPKEKAYDVEEYFIEYYLRDAIKGHRNVEGDYLIHSGYNANTRFYVRRLQKKGVKISYKHWVYLKKGDRVFTHQQAAQKYIEENYNYDTLQLVENVVKYEIHGRKNN